MMISATGNKPATGSPEPRRAAAFTLVELVLVMAMLLTVIALAAPSLGRFFRGRTLGSEAQRLLSLTRYGQSRAASEGIPMVLWIDTRENRYGLEQEAGYADVDARAVAFQAGDDLQFELLFSSAPDRRSAGNRATPALVGGRPLPALRFEPDGSIGEGSPESVRIRQDDLETVWVARSLTRLSYEIRTNTPLALAR